mmetsp:Transcript_17459/g.25460  ORF Transcript_17459/g.25460 Transcript_17459/m.25460 type:complete len:118 (-) Transcript_17459:407-760(-)
MSSNEDDTATSATKHIATTRTISPDDNRYMKQAIDAASRGVGNTFPNPAVGCVLVSKNKDQGEDEVLGVGFHPKAGYPHAEVFALFEACVPFRQDSTLRHVILTGGRQSRRGWIPRS